MLMIDIAPQSQLSSPATPSTGIHHAGESSTLPHKIGHANETLSTLKDIGPSYTIHRPEHAIQPPLPPLCLPVSTSHNVQASYQTYSHLRLCESSACRPSEHQLVSIMYSRLPFRVAAFPRTARGVLSPIASFRTPSRSAPIFQHLLRSNTGRSCSTPPLPPHPWIRTSSLGGKLVERDGRHANLWLRNEAKPWESICESLYSDFFQFLSLFVRVV